jgi:hypothetical protein
MASIAERNGKYTVDIRKKGIDLFQTFEKKSDAELWAAYKEEMIDLIDAFDPPLNEMITLQDAIELKIRRVEEKNANKKEINDYKMLQKSFEKFCPKYINEIKYTDLLKQFVELIKTPVYQGGTGKNDGTGIKKMPAFLTIFRKFSYLSTVFQMLINDGVEIENVAIKICQYARSKKNEFDESPTNE